MPVWLSWVVSIFIGVGIVAVPAVHYRANLETSKRFHVVTAGRFYRCGQLDADGLKEVIRLHGIKTVINLQHEAPDPSLPKNFYQSKIRILESEVCRDAGADFKLLTFEPFPRELPEGQRPVVVDNYLKMLDDPEIYPVLIHCAAGLHRTGELTAIYRMEYEGWSKSLAVREMRSAGFGDYACTSADDMVYNMVDKFEPGIRKAKAGETR